MTRIWLYTVAFPGLLGLATMAAIVLPGDDLTLTRLLAGCGAMIAVQVIGGYLGGRASVRR
ncbi:hypothetical protein OG252_13170 [Streptomyces sp. NBC_01352]|uniref:hypothetical protein n=1 Tax=Streptomyces sp. NBC_01352 TaxID=2903834 RepID=UPI002E32CF56|nr:hypothetical protein [Streptomyces sp. NBC_01352]